MPPIGPVPDLTNALRRSTVAAAVASAIATETAIQAVVATASAAARNTGRRMDPEIDIAVRRLRRPPAITVWPSPPVVVT